MELERHRRPPCPRTPKSPRSSQMTGITIRFPGVLALDGVDFRLRGGEIHSLMGENGAGKSTLIKALTGVYPIDSGTIVVAGEPRVFAQHRRRPERRHLDRVPGGQPLREPLGRRERHARPRAAQRRRHRLEGRAPRGRAPPRRASACTSTRARSCRATRSRSSSSSPSAARWCSTPRCSSSTSRPRASTAARSSSCSPSSATSATSGVAILFVSHFLDQVYEISDRITVLRNGQLVGEYLAADLPRETLVTKMIGRELDELAAISSHDRPRRSTAPATPVLRATGVGRRGVLEPADLDVYEGEVVGIAGLLGSGRTELVRLLYGADRADSGQIEVNGTAVRMTSPRARDRPPHRVLVRGPPGRGRHRRPDRRREHRARHPGPARVDATRPPQPSRTPSSPSTSRPSTCARPTRTCWPRNLSGGNQQKVLLARWLATAPRAASCSTSRPAASTSARRPTSSARSPSCRSRACPSSSSRPSSKKCFGSPSASS